MTRPLCAPALTLLLVAALPCLSSGQNATARLATGASLGAGKGIALDQLGAEAQKQYQGDGISITPMPGKAGLRAVMQDLEGEAASDGLWLTSTADEDAGTPNRFRVRAVEIGREGAILGHQKATVLQKDGRVSATKDMAACIRPGLVEEYSVSTDGVRQDFVVLDRPAGDGNLQVWLDVTGAKAETAVYGARLTVEATGRELAYSRLKVTDATGRQLTASMKVEGASQLRIAVEDRDAVYPVRIDPTFSDADWVGLGVGIPGADTTVMAMAVDSAGSLYIGGAFTTVGGLQVNQIAKWNGSSWSGLGVGVTGEVRALAVSGTTVYAGGFFTSAGDIDGVGGIAKWNGTSWSAMGEGTSGFVETIAVSGANVYVGGLFSVVDGNPASNVARWDGSQWHAMGSGFNDAVQAIAVSGATIYAGGLFTADPDGTVALARVARWTGTKWVGLGAGVDGTSVNALAASSAGLYVGGSFTQAGPVKVTNIARWTGSAWAAMGPMIDPDDPNDDSDPVVWPGVDGQVTALAASGSTIYVGGSFTQAGLLLVDNIARWNGAAWSAVGPGLLGTAVEALVVSGSSVYAGGTFVAAGDTTLGNVARWNGSAWDGMTNGLTGPVNALAVSGTTLYAGGQFTEAGKTKVNYIARWNGSAWSAMGAGMNGEVKALAVSGSIVYAGGFFTEAGGQPANGIARWNGSAWSALGDGVDGFVLAIALRGNEVFVGGGFQNAGGSPANNIAMWNGTSWSALGDGIGDGLTPPIFALAADDEHLYAGGEFTTAGGVSANHIALWKNNTWSALGSGIDSVTDHQVMALVLNGADLFVGGTFSSAGGVMASNVARWNGTNWSPLGGGMDDAVHALAVQGTSIYAGGVFTEADGNPAKYVARWDGASWNALGSGTDNTVLALAASSTTLYIGGQFNIAGNKAASYAARASLRFPGVRLGNVILSAASVTLQGSVNPQGSAATALFEYGTDTNYGEAALATVSPIGGTAFVNVAKAIAGLTPGTVYHYRLAATNALGTSYTSDATFVIPEGTLAFNPAAGTVINIREDVVDHKVRIPIIRTGPNGGSVSVTASTTNGTALAPSDYAALVNVPVTFGDAVSSDDLEITINDPPATNEGTETFTVKLSGPFVTPGGVSTVTVRIIDSVDGVAPPLPTITFPAAGALVGVNSGAELTVTGTATDGESVGRVEVTLNGVLVGDALLASPGATSTTWSRAIVPITGTNTLSVKTFDTLGAESSSSTTRSFIVTRPLEVTLDGDGAVTAGFTPTPSYREVGKSITITATPKTGRVFVRWSLDNALNPLLTEDEIRAQIGVAASALERPSLIFVFKEGLQLTARFEDNPYDATGAQAISGTYNGLIEASTTLPERDDPEEDGSVPGTATEGRFTATVMSTGAFSGKLTIDGLVLNTAGIFDHDGVARFGTARATTLAVPRPGKPSLIVQFKIGGPTASAVDLGKIEGQVTAPEFQQSKTASVSTVEADRAFYTGLTGLTVPDQYLTVTGTAPSPTGRTDGVFTVVLPSLPLSSQPDRISQALTVDDYPAGDGVGTLRVTKAGAVTLVGTLADGTAVTMTGTLSQGLRAGLFAQLYTAKGFLSAPIQLDSTQIDSDLKKVAGGEVLWSRPFNSASHYYPYGWAETLELDLLGAKYIVTANESVVRAANRVKLQAPDGDGNVSLTFSDGLLSDSLVKSANLSTGDAVTKVPSNDPTFTMAVSRTAGTITGTFAHTDDTKPAYKLIIFQKGPNAGAYGYFLTKQPVPIDYTGASGGVTLIGQP